MRLKKIYKDLQIEDTYKDFIKSKDLLKNAKISTDIGWHTKHTSEEEMTNLISNLRTNRTAKSDEKVINGKYKFIGKYGGYLVYQPLDHIASMDLGVNTGWCTTGRYQHYGDPSFKPSEEAAKEHWDDYTSKGVKFYYFLDPRTYFGKWAVALYDRAIRVNKAFKDKFIVNSNVEIYNDKDVLIFDPIIMKLCESFGVHIELEFADRMEDGMVMRGSLLAILVEQKSNVVIPESVKIVGKDAFKGRLTLKSVVISDSVEVIEEGAFDGCLSLNSITIPASVKSIGDKAFANLPNIGTIKVRGNQLSNSVRESLGQLKQEHKSLNIIKEK